MQQLDNEEINLLDLFLVLLKRKRLILGVTFGITLITAIYSVMLPNVYRAQAVIMPPRTQTNVSQLMGQNTNVAAPVNSADFFQTILTDKSSLDHMVEMLNKKNMASNKDALRSKLKTELKVSADKKTGLLIIAMEDKDPKMAADLANLFVVELKNRLATLALTAAGQKRIFHEEQLKNAREELIKAEEAMQGFQEKTGAIKIDAQTTEAVRNIASLNAQVVSKEIALRVMKTYATAYNPEVQKAEEELKGLKDTLMRNKGQGNDLSMHTNSIPLVSKENIRKSREVKFYESLYEILLKQYEAAKLDEANDAGVMQIIEEAAQPKSPIKPARKKMVVLAASAGFFLSIFAAFLLEFIQKLFINQREKIALLRKYAGLKGKG